MIYLFIALGGALGACLRYFLVQQSMLLFGKEFPYGVLIVNVIGALCIGSILGYLENYTGPNALFIKQFVVIGLLGALTTFSTFSFDTVALLQTGAWAKAILNIGTNVILCTACTWLAFSFFKG